MDFGNGLIELDGPQEGVPRLFETAERAIAAAEVGQADSVFGEKFDRPFEEQDSLARPPQLVEDGAEMAVRQRIGGSQLGSPPQRLLGFVGLSVHEEVNAGGDQQLGEFRTALQGFAVKLNGFGQLVVFVERQGALEEKGAVGGHDRWRLRMASNSTARFSIE